MKVMIFGSTGMVGQAALLECIRSDDVSEVLVVVRRGGDEPHKKVRELVVPDLASFPNVAGALGRYDACLFCAGVSSVGMSEEAYTKVTFELTMTVANLLARQNPPMVFVYVTGKGTDGSEQGDTMWARIKGKTENALMALPFRGAYMFRPGYIHPMDGIKSRTLAYRLGIIIARPFYPVLRRLWPDSVTTTRNIGRAMLAAVREGSGKRVVETPEINVLGAQA
ncbi:MAG: NAD-dependent epimerase/dehydratase family protein [Myxococcota bacterium]|nr:NAD-dependent epimerase/dehydratase family protein [Myxococcota bacterium]